jgi:hypothetical protein
LHPGQMFVRTAEVDEVRDVGDGGKKEEDEH